MTLVLNGTTGVSAVDGSASTPAIQGADTNTGMFFPAADTIAFSTAGTEDMRIDSSGNVGIGTSSLSNGVRAVIQGSQTGGAPQTSGTTQTYGLLRLQGTSFTSVLDFGTNGGNYNWIQATDNSNLSTKYILALNPNGGPVSIGVTGQSAVSGISGYLSAKNALNDGSWGLALEQTGTSNCRGIGISYGYAPNSTFAEYCYFIDTSATRFAVRSNGGVANYSANNVNLSDRREKTNFAPAGEWLPKICAIPVQTFNYADQNLEEDPGLTLGVVAQDVQAIAPELVMESNWGTQDDPKMRLSIYQTDLQYALMKCIQEQQALITSQAAAIESLTARVQALEAQT
jgi:hypothetical protein